MSYLHDITVHYGDNASSEPSDGIQTVDANNADVNSGFGGKYVWLSPKYNSDSDGVTSIRIIVQGDADSSYSDLAKDAGGDYRYLRLERGGSGITNVRILRRKDSVDFNTVKSLGFSGFSSDINAGRGGDFLYLVWKY
ncbi:hypothetical protein BDW59DRAFT_163108 [Aspergillus cavernicola]|uniref:Uncharacterized protein n=1 Tax=Aspergillus cavernicola TaxID=176166 RepID=A0ABR4I722_9EURO